MSALVRLLVIFAFADAAYAAAWGCYGTKPGHPTPEERTAFVHEVSRLAVAAEKKHGVPAAALAALAIVESGYGWTRLAVHANNLFAWKHTAGDRDQRTYVPVCQRNRKKRDRYVHFANRAEAFDHVSERLATRETYREYTAAYREARKRGEGAERAVRAWVTAVSRHYSRKPKVFVEKMLRVMDDPEQLGRAAARPRSLYELSREAGRR